MKKNLINLAVVAMISAAMAAPQPAAAKNTKPNTPPGQEKPDKPKKPKYEKPCVPPTLTPAVLAKKVRLGEIIFHDNRLSEPAGQSCAYCHSDGSGFNGNGDASHAVFEGAMPGRFGLRNPPAAAYAGYSPPFSLSSTGYVGGQFWDGRARDLVEQAKAPFLNPVEMNNQNGVMVSRKVLESNYASLYLQVYGACGIENGNTVFTNIADALAAYEASQGDVNRFSSRYDLYLKDPVRNPLSPAEERGRLLFEAKCSSCHPTAKAPGAPGPLFTDFTYDNVGIPRNFDIPYYKSNPWYADLGLGTVIKQVSENGKFKVPSLRNAAISPPYGHNGYFRTLKEIVNFYNTRDVPNMWPAPEVMENLNTREMGSMALTGQDEDDIVAFLETLTDGAVPPRR